MARYSLNTPANLDQIKKFISDTLNITYGKQPANIVFVCGDAHRPTRGTGAELDLCNKITEWICNNEFAPYCSFSFCRNSISLHLECGNDQGEVHEILKSAKIEDLRNLGLTDNNVNGWEPIGFANLLPIAELMQKQEMSQEDQTQTFVLLNQSNVYFRSLTEPWTGSIIQSISELALTVTNNFEIRSRALNAYQNTLFDQRINANMVLGKSMNQAVTRFNRLFIHFISVGNAHITEGETIINGIDITTLPNVIGISIGRIIN